MGQGHGRTVILKLSWWLKGHGNWRRNTHTHWGGWAGRVGGRSKGGKEGGGTGEGGERQTAVILLVILSGSPETRALLRQFSEDKVRTFLRTLLGLLRCSAMNNPSLFFPSPFPHILFFTLPVYLCLKAEAINSSALTITFSSSLQFCPSLNRKTQSFEFSSVCPHLFIPPFHCSCSRQSLHFVLASYSNPGQVQFFAFTPSFL